MGAVVVLYYDTLAVVNVCARKDIKCVCVCVCVQEDMNDKDGGCYFHDLG